MMPTIKELRAAAGGLANLTDEDIIGATFPSYQRYYGNVDDFAKAVGYGGAGRGLAGSRVSSGVDSYQSNLYGLGGAVARKAGLDGVAGWMDEGRDRNEQAAQYAQQRAKDLGGVDDWREVDGVGSGLNYLGGLAAQSLPYVGEAIAGGVTGGLALTGTAARMGLGAAARGAARTAGATAASYPSAVGDILANQREAGGEDLGMAALGGVPYAALNAFGVEGLAARGFRPLAAGQGGLARRMATGATTTALGEGVGETGQELTNQYFGRMAVDPNETLFNDDANKRYLDSFVGGAALGGVFGGAGGIRRPRTVDQGQFDLTGNGNQDTRQLGYNPDAGNYIEYPDGSYRLASEPINVFPNGTATLNEDQAVLARNGMQPMGGQIVGDLQQEDAANKQKQQIAQETLLETSKLLGVAPAANLTDAYDVLGARVYGQPQVAKLVQDVATINAQLSPDQQQLNAAVLGANLVNLGGKTSIPTAQKIANAVAGKLKQLQLDGVDTVARAIEILNDQVATLVAAGKNEGDIKLGQIATVYEKLTGQAPPALTAAPAAAAPATAPAAPVVEKQQPTLRRAPAPEGKTNVSQGVSTAAPAAPGVDGRSAVVPGSVVDTGRAAPVDQGLGTDAGVAGPAAQQAAPVPNADVQQPAAVEADANPVDALLAKHFNGDARKAQIAKAYLTAIKLAPKGSKGQVVQAIATQFGIKPVTVRKYGNTTELRATAASMGFSPEQIEALNLPDNTKDAPTAKVTLAPRVRDGNVTELPYMGPGRNADANAPKDPAKTQAMAAAGFETAEDVESSGFGGMDESNTWKQGREGMGDTGNSKDEAKANEIASLLDQQDALRNLIEEYEQEGQTDLIEGVQTQIETLQSKLDASLKALEGYLQGKAKKVSSKLGNELKAEAKAESKKGKKAAKAAKAAAAPEVDEDTTPAAERAADAWNEVADSMGSSFPQFQDLSTDDQETFTEFGEGNWTRQDVVKFAQDTGGDFESAKFGKPIKAVKAKNPYTAKELLADIKDFIRADIPGRKLLIVDSIEDLLRHPDKRVRAVGAAIAIEGAYGVAVDGRAFLVADRIEKGAGRAKFMHEVGGHLGLDNLLPKAVYDKLTQQIIDWAKKDDGSIESELALNAAERVQNAGTPKEDVRSELLAYFIEEAMEAGVDPTSDVKSSGPLREWFRTLWTAFKVAARKLGMKPESMTAQDVVNLAFGAARLEINGTWHGTAAAFRNFSNKFIGSGEGATAYGWGTYLAQRTGIAKGYWVADVARKGGGLEGNLMRVDTAIDDGLMFDYDKPIGKQSGSVKLELLDLLGPAANEITERTNKDIDELNGRDLFGTGENDLGLLSNLIMDDVLMPTKADAKFDEAVRQGKFHEAASHLLRTLGVEGIKFYDAKSRGSATNAISFDGRTYNRDDLRDQVRKYRDTNVDKAMQFLLLKDILRNGIDDVRAEIESKVAKQEKMIVDVYADSAARYNVKADAAADRARAREEAAKSPYGRQLAWLNANEKEISLVQNTKTRNLIVFDDKNIFRVGSEVAADRQRMKFGKPASSVPPAVEKEVGIITKSLKAAADAALNAVMFSEDLFKRASSMGLGAAMDMDRIYRERAALTGSIERDVKAVEDLYNRIPQAERGTGTASANRFLYDSTRESKWGFKPDWRDAKASPVKIDAAMQQRYLRLSPESKAWVRGVLSHGDKMLAIKKRTLLDSTTSEYDALIADAKSRGETEKVTRMEADKAKSLKQFQRLFATNEFAPYAPMRRFGNWVVVGKSKEYMAAQTDAERTKLESDPDHYHVSFAESRSAALELERELSDSKAFAAVSTRAKEAARNDMYGGLMSAFTKLRTDIETELQGATDATEIAALRKARETIAELYLASLAENSARKSEMRRRGVSGEIDMLRSFSTQGRADAHFLASAKYNPQTQQAVVKMRQQKNTGTDQLAKSEAFKEIMARHEQSMKFEDGGWFDAANKASRVTSVWMLASSPMYYLQNMTQPMMLSLPFMTERHNYLNAFGKLTQAYTQLGGLLTSARAGEGFDFTKVPKDVRAMISTLVDRGRIDIGMDTELGRVKLEGSNIGSRAINRIDETLRALSQKMEALNRVSTAMAAYRLELARTKGDEKAATEYADRVISQTHGDYTRINAPRLFNTPGGKVALQFRKFQLIQLTLLAKLFHNSFKGATPAERAGARRALTFTLAHTGVLAGVVGMPGFAAAAFVIGKLADLFGDDDEPYNLENEMRKALGGGEFAQMVMRGAPTLVGSDLSGKLGMGNALSILPYTDFEASREGFNAIVTGLVLGATGGLATRVYEGLGDISNGDMYRGLEKLAPKGIADGMKAYRESQDGATRRNGDVLVTADEMAGWQTFATAIGWPTAAASERRFDTNIAYDNKEAFDGKATQIKNAYAKARKANDPEAATAAIDRWKNLQRSRQEAGFKTQPLSTLMKAPQEQAKRERNTAGGVQFDRNNRRFVQEQTAN